MLPRGRFCMALIVACRASGITTPLNRPGIGLLTCTLTVHQPQLFCWGCNREWLMLCAVKIFNFFSSTCTEQNSFNLVHYINIYTKRAYAFYLHILIKICNVRIISMPKLVYAIKVCSMHKIISPLFIMNLFIGKEVESNLNYVYYFHLNYKCLEFDLFWEFYLHSTQSLTADQIL
jgi:hypothetical protein